MTEEEFGKAYIANKDDIEQELKGLQIYDMDLYHDTYIALYEDSQEKEIRNFKNADMSYTFDRAESSDTDYNEEVGRRVDAIIDYYCTHPPKGARNHECACEILKLFCKGLSIREIAAELGIGKSTAHQYIACIIRQIKRQYGQ